MAKRSKVYTGSEWVDLASSATDLSNYANLTTTPISGFRNAIINGDFRINQRGFTSATADNSYGFDRWMIEVSGGCTYTPVAFALGNAISGYEPINHARLVTTGQSGAGVYSVLEQRIEDVRTYAGQTIIISFWAKAASGTPKVSVEMNQFWGSSATTNNNAGSVTLSTTWQRYSVTTTLGSASGKTIAGNHHLGLLLWVSAGTNFSARTNSIGIQSNTFDFWGVQIEKGTVATPFEQRPIGTELSLCQRYFFRFADDGAITNYAGGTVEGADAAAIAGGVFPVRMRRVPDLAFGANLKFFSPTTTTRTPVISANRCSTTHFALLVTFGGGATVGQSCSIYNAGGGNAHFDCSSEL